MNDQLLNSYYYTPHFSNYVVRGLSFCLLGGRGEDGGKIEKKKGETVFLFPVPLSLFPSCFKLANGLRVPVGKHQTRSGTRRWGRSWIE